jgi:hypothetical protein
MMMVVNFTSKAASMYLASTDGSYTTSGWQLPLDGSGANLQYNVFNTSNSTSSNPATGTTYIVTVVDSITNAFVYVNGTQVLTTTGYSGVANRNFSNFDIGGWSGDTTKTFNGKLGEVKFYKGTMSTIERASVEASLGAKWGVAVSSTATRNSNMITASVNNGKLYVKSEATSVGLTLHGFNVNL